MLETEVVRESGLFVAVVVVVLFVTIGLDIVLFAVDTATGRIDSVVVIVVAVAVGTTATVTAAVAIIFLDSSTCCSQSSYVEG